MAKDGQSGQFERGTHYDKSGDTLQLVISHARIVGEWTHLGGGVEVLKSFADSVAQLRIGNAARVLRPVVDFAKEQVDPKKRRAELGMLSGMSETLAAIKRYHPDVIRDSRQKLKKEVADAAGMLRQGRYEEFIDRFPDITDAGHENYIVICGALRSVNKPTKDAALEAIAERAWQSVQGGKPGSNILEFPTSETT